MTHAKNGGMRRGFTLIEVAVVLVLLSLLAAFVMPDVIKHINDGDPTRVEMDLRSVENALDSWYIDNRRVMPGDLEDLVHVVDPGTDTGILPTIALSTADSLRWDGPYLRISVPETGASAATADSVKTGYSGWIKNELALHDFSSTVAGTTAPACDATAWLTVTIVGLADSEFEQVNDLVDGSDEGDGSADPEDSWRAGNLRRSGTNTYFLAKPCRGATS